MQRCCYYILFDFITISGREKFLKRSTPFQSIYKGRIDSTDAYIFVYFLLSTSNIILSLGYLPSASCCPFAVGESLNSEE
jgi:hypothetical protein